MLTVLQVITILNGSLTGKKIGILGYAFKKGTTDTRESQAIDVIRELLKECPAEIAIFDPRCHRQDVQNELTSFFCINGTEIFKPHGPVEVYLDPYEACERANALLILTEWDQFRYPSPRQDLGIVEPNTVFGKSVSSPLEHDMSRLGILGMRAALLDDISQLENIQVLSDQQNDAYGRFLPEPECPDYCRDCARGYEEQERADDGLCWERVAQIVERPRWVFDGRGVVDQTGMEKLGFKVETTGKASVRTRLRGELF